MYPQDRGVRKQGTHLSQHFIFKKLPNSGLMFEISTAHMIPTQDRVPPLTGVRRGEIRQHISTAALPDNQPADRRTGAGYPSPRQLWLYPENRRPSKISRHQKDRASTSLRRGEIADQK